MNRFAIALLAGVAGVSVMSSAFAADLIIDEPAPAVGIVSTTGNWDGLFIGAFAGAGWGTVTDEDGYFGNGIDAETDLTGWQLGVNAGANFTVSEAIVAGIVGDIAWTDLNGDVDADSSYSVDWAGSIRGRLGFDGGAFLPYVTAGVAFANATVTDGALEDTQTHIGWTVGAGVEFAVADNVSLDLQYRYTDYGSKDYELGAAPTESFGLTSHAVTAGVNFRF
ncbi:MAG: porin family protein [Hyphomicrobiales bacterium]|nr:MAG: porin family protein [Hyphomicrobiales bacterium]